MQRLGQLSSLPRFERRAKHSVTIGCLVRISVNGVILASRLKCSYLHGLRRLQSSSWLRKERWSTIVCLKRSKPGITTCQLTCLPVIGLRNQHLLHSLMAFRSLNTEDMSESTSPCPAGIQMLSRLRYDSGCGNVGLRTRDLSLGCPLQCGDGGHLPNEC